MCGIVGWKADSKVLSIEALVKTAFANKHRGSNDGIGVVDLDSGKSTKVTHSLQEIVNGALAQHKGTVLQRNGIVEEVAFSHELYNERNDKFKTWRESFVGVKSKNVVLHHRRSTCGDVKLANTHPISVGKEHKYMHNGTLFGYEALRAFAKFTYGWEFKGDTDTEVVGNLINYLLDEKKMKPDTVHTLLETMFPYGFGVIIRINVKSGKVEIFKDIHRTLFFYTNPGETLFVSEPVAGIDNFSKLYKMGSGYHVLGDKLDEDLFDDVTDAWKNAISGWKLAVSKDRFNKNPTKCKTCEVEKQEVMWLPQGHTNAAGMIDICFPCWVDTDWLEYKPDTPKEYPSYDVL